MTDLATLVEPLKRELAVPGTFEGVFPDTLDEDLVGSLKDAFSEARLQGFFADVALDGQETTPDLSLAGGALVVLFASQRIIRAQLRVLVGGSRYKAGPVEFEQTRPATLLRDELAIISKRLDDLIVQARRLSGARDVTVFDGYSGRVAMAQVGGFHAWEVAR